MKLLMSEEAIAADRSKWLEIRRNSIGASEIAAIMGVPGSYASATSVYWNKVAGDTIPSSFQMELGTYLEEFVAAKFAAAHPGLEVQPGGLYASDEFPWMTATFDRLAVLDAEAWDVFPVQIKTSNTREGYGDDGTDEIPPHYLAQVIWEMRAGGFSRAYVPVLFLQGGKLRTYEIPWDADAQADAEVMISEAQAFLERVEHRKPPPVDWRPQTTAALKRVYANVEDREVVIPDGLARRLLSAKAALKKAAERYLLQENEVRARLGTAERAVRKDGTVVATRSVVPVKEHTRKAGTRDTLRVRQPKEEGR